MIVGVASELMRPKLLNPIFIALLPFLGACNTSSSFRRDMKMQEEDIVPKLYAKLTIYH